MFDPSAVFYMDKLVAGPEAAEFVDIEAPISVNVRRVAKAKRVTPEDVTVVVLDRPRHDGIIKEIRETGARIKLISDGDVAGSILALREGTGVDLLLGIGGTPEGIISACAVKCLGGVIQGKLWPKDDAERQRALDAGHDLDRVLTTDDLVSGRTCSSSPPGSRTGSCCGGSLPGGDRDHRLDRDAVQVRDGQADRFGAPVE